MAEYSNYFAKLEGLLGEPEKPHEPEYFEWLGRFVTSYAKAEAAVHVLARKLSGLDDLRARVVFGGMRLGDLTDRARQMFRMDLQPDIFAAGDRRPRSQVDYDYMDVTLTHLDKIAAIRHELVHRMVTYIEHSLVVSNSFTAKSYASAQSRSVSLGDLKAMEDDCGKIFLRLFLVTDRTALTGALDAAQIETLVSLPWRYKPDEQVPQKKSLHKGAIQPPPPPEPSRA
jgi:hypothetical protein